MFTVPYGGLQFYFFPIFENYFNGSKLISGGLSGGLAYGLLYPIDTVRRNMQLTNKFQNSWECTKM